MQAALAFGPAVAASFVQYTLPCSSGTLRSHKLPLAPLHYASTRQSRAQICWAQQTSEQDPYVTYDQKKSVFPAEACEELGGDSCEIDGVGPEVKLQGSPAKNPIESPLGGKDRDYVEYTEAKTVFPGEACEELGGEFCEPEYQSGVFPEKVAAK